MGSVAIIFGLETDLLTKMSLTMNTAKGIADRVKPIADSGSDIDPTPADSGRGYE